jgi:hypothetical protein
MSLLTEARYRAITGDETTAASAISDAIDQAEELLADALGRELESAQRTERLRPTRDGFLWPTCTPITVATGYTIDGHGLRGPFGPAWPDETGRVSVTYTGGWVERTANTSATNRLPICIERDLAYAAAALITAPAITATSPYPVGATSVRLGDAAVTFGADGAPRRGSDVVVWSRRTLAYRASTLRGAGAC